MDLPPQWERCRRWWSCFEANSGSVLASARYTTDDGREYFHNARSLSSWSMWVDECSAIENQRKPADQWVQRNLVHHSVQATTNKTQWDRPSWDQAYRYGAWMCLAWLRICYHIKSYQIISNLLYQYLEHEFIYVHFTLLFAKSLTFESHRQEFHQETWPLWAFKIKRPCKCRHLSQVSILQTSMAQITAAFPEVRIFGHRC